MRGFEVYINDEGIYKGPKVWGLYGIPSSISVRHSPNLKSFGTLEVCKGFVILEYSPKALTSLSPIKEIHGYLNTYRTSITDFSSLIKIKNDLLVQDTPCFKNLEVVKGTICFSGALPYLPSLVGDCKAQYVTGEYDATSRHSKGIHKARSYRYFEKQVTSIPAEDLIPLRTEKPFLYHLIDARLKGDLK